MAAEDELALPGVPDAKPDDPEDVSWGLSTAEAMWARGDHLEGIKWVRKAAEAAADAENDERYLELVKAASDLTSLIARRSRASISDAPGQAGGAPPEAPPPVAPPLEAPPPEAPPPPPTSPAPISASRPPPMPPKSAPPVPPKSAPPAAARSQAPPAAARSQAPLAPRSAPRPLATNDARQGPQPGRGILTNRTVPAGALDTAPLAAVDGETAARALRADRQGHPEPDPTVVGRVDDLVRAERDEREKSAAEWDASPTRDLTGDEMDEQMAEHMDEMAERMSEGDRKTTTFTVPVVVPPAPSIVAPAPRPAPAAVHDPGIHTSQAVRVVVWRDGNGVHIAPAGTVVSSITIDAMLVALEPSADLTAWLSKRER